MINLEVKIIIMWKIFMDNNAIEFQTTKDRTATHRVYINDE